MNKQIEKNVFDGMELPEQTKQEVWGNLESIISNTTVEKRVHKNRVWVRRLGKTAAAFLIMGVLFGTINGVSHGGLVEAISGLWQTDESSQKIVTEMTDYHVRLDSVYAPEILECTEKRLIFAGSFGLVIYDRQSERVAATIDLQKIESNHFNADTLQTRFLIRGDELVIYNLQNKKVFGKSYHYNLSTNGKKETSSLLPVTTQKADAFLEKEWQKQNKGKYADTLNFYAEGTSLYKDKEGLLSEKALISKEGNTISSAVWLTLEKDKTKDDYQMYLYQKRGKQGTVKKEKLRIQASAEKEKTTVLKRYEELGGSEIKKAIVETFYDNSSLYEGYVYQGSQQYQKVEFGDCDVVIPIVKITGTNRQNDTIKVIGQFYWYGFSLSGKTLYEAQSGGGVAVMFLKKDSDGYQVKKVVRPRDGGLLQKDLVKLYGSDGKAVSDVLGDSLTDEVVKTLRTYVKQNQLDIKYYKAFGWDPERIDKYGCESYNSICYLGKSRERNIMLEPKEVNLSPMPKTWILDLDGTIVVHDGPYILGHDKFLPGAKEFLDGISEYDMIIFLTARGEWEKEHTLRFLKENHVRYDHIIFGAGQGERVLINDNKPDGLVTAVAVNTTRDKFCQTKFQTDYNLGTRFD